MIAKKGLKGIATLILGLMLAAPGFAMAEVQLPEPLAEARDAQSESTQSETDRSSQENPEPVETAPPEPTPPPASTGAPDPVPTPGETPVPSPEMEQAQKPDSGNVSAQPVAPAPEIVEIVPKPAPEIEVKEYSVSWAAGAFPLQTVNYQDELVIGLGATCAIDLSRDIQILVNGSKPTSKLKGISISCASSNPKYLAVSSVGKLKGARRGSAQLFVTVQLPDGVQKQLRKNIKIVDEPRIRFAPDSAVIENGARLDLSQFAKAPILMASPNVNAGITYSIAPLGTTTGSKVSLDRKTGKLAVSYERPGDAYVVTAKTYGGEKATFTIYLGQRTQRIEILVAQSAIDEDGRVSVQAGNSLALKAVAYDMAGGLAARQDMTWAVIGGSQYAAIDGDGMLTAVQSVDRERAVIVAAMASDGSGASAQVSLTIEP